MVRTGPLPSLTTLTSTDSPVQQCPLAVPRHITASIGRKSPWKHSRPLRLVSLRRHTRPYYIRQLAPSLLHNFALPLFRTISITASTPACATSVSCAGVPVLHPTAPTTSPSTLIGIPPATYIKRPPLLLFSPNAAPPGHTASLYALVGTLWPAAVNALFMAMSIEVSFAPGMRSKCRRKVEASTMAMFMGMLMEWALSVHAAEAAFAAARVRCAGRWMALSAIFWEVVTVSRELCREDDTPLRSVGLYLTL